MSTFAASGREENQSAKKQRSRLSNFCNFLSKLSETTAAILLIALVVLNLAQIFFRYVIVDPLSWTEEGMRYFAIWMTFLAIVPALIRGEHMTIDLLRDVASLKLQRIVGNLVLIVIGGFCVLLIWKGLDAAIGNLKQVSPAIRITRAIPFAAIPVGAGLTLIHVICTLLDRDVAIHPDILEGEIQ